MKEKFILNIPEEDLPSDFNPKKKKSKKILLISLSFLALIFVAFVVYAVIIVSGLKRVEITKDDNQLGITSEVLENKPDDSITNIALFGIDSRGEDKSRSDAIMVLTVDKKHNKIKLSSIMRDSYVAIDGRGKDKINHAYYYGGPELAIKTINQNFDLNIRDFVSVDFSQLATIIDAVGGVEIDVTQAERINANASILEQANILKIKPIPYIKKSGIQTLNGIQAVGYARIRYVGNGDYERTDRQRLVLKKVFEKALNMNKLAYPEMVRKLLPSVTTSLNYSEIIKLSSIMMKSPTFEDVRFPQEQDLINGGGVTINGTWYLQYNLKETARKIHEFIYNDINPVNLNENSNQN